MYMQGKRDVKHRQDLELFLLKTKTIFDEVYRKKRDKEEFHEYHRGKIIAQRK